MTPQINQYVKIIFKNTVQLEGVVDSWTDKQIILRSSDNNNLLIIQHPEEILVIKIILKQNYEKKTELENEFQKIYNEPSEDNLRLKKMADLKTMLAHQEKKIFSEKLRDHVPTSSGLNTQNYEERYGTPIGIFKK